MRKATLLFIALALSGCAGAPSTSAPPTPAPDLGKRLVADNAVVASAHPQASEAGVEMLRRGGNAVDAAIATAFAVSVGEPQMSGVGGSGSMLIWLEDEGRAEFVDFYAAQPAAAFRGEPEPTGRTDLRVVGVPGEVAGLLSAHERFGTLPLAEILAPAIRMAEEGVAVNQILAQMIARDSAKLARYDGSAAAFLPGGRPLKPGDVLRQPELARTLRRIAEQGREGFYRGETARAVVEAMNAGGHPVTLEQFAGFSPRWKRPMCGLYRGRVVLSAPPPQMGAQIIETLKLLEPYDLPALGLPTRSARAFDVMASALRVGIADARVVDDPAWVAVPAAGMVTDAYARERGRLVGTGSAVDDIDRGDATPFTTEGPAGACAALDPYVGAAGLAAGEGEEPTMAMAPGDALRAPSGGEGATGETADEPTGETTHLSVVDADGNAVALTQTNSSLFGSGARVAGFFLNNSGYNFRGDPPANAETDWRVRRSTISPTIVLDGDDVRMVVGAPGGGRIPTAIAQNMVYVLDYGLDPLTALRMPRIFPSVDNPRVQLENGFPADVLSEIRAAGYDPGTLSFGYARLYMVTRVGDQWIGVADPRHDGEVRGY
ncbi:MAG TPA: gamma-glutamyltransferase family protein [Longimicrobiales bacterium]|nr:gamma-glutamyltransferase family protein [Longimicrobiales bacterium]